MRDINEIKNEMRTAHEALCALYAQGQSPKAKTPEWAALSARLLELDDELSAAGGSLRRMKEPPQ